MELHMQSRFGFIGERHLPDSTTNTRASGIITIDHHLS